MNFGFVAEPRSPGGLTFFGFFLLISKAIPPPSATLCPPHFTLPPVTGLPPAPRLSEAFKYDSEFYSSLNIY